ncbi:Protein BNI4 [Yarrowia sp. E02]|nr:Protein BNI4 [Yarrowia sp. E02]
MSARTRSMSPGRPLRQPQKSPYTSHSQQLQQQHLAQLQQLQQLNQRFGSSNSSFSSSSSHTPTQPSSANSTHSSSRHSVYGTHNYASSDVNLNNRSVSQPALAEPVTPNTVPDRYRRKSMVNLPSHQRSPSLPNEAITSSTTTTTQGSHVTSPSTAAQTYSAQQAHTTNNSTSNNSPPPRLSYSSTDSSAPSTTAASTSTIGTVHSFHKKTHSRDLDDHQHQLHQQQQQHQQQPPPQPRPQPMVLPSDARRKSLLSKDPMGNMQDQRASAISLSSYHTVQSNSSPTRSMISDDSRESSPDIKSALEPHDNKTLGSKPALNTDSQLNAVPRLAPPASYETVATGVAPVAEPVVQTVTATATAAASVEPTSHSNYDVVSSQYDAPAQPEVAPVENVAISTLDPGSDRGRYRAKHSPPLASPAVVEPPEVPQKEPQYLTQQQHVNQVQQQRQQQQQNPSPPVSQPSHQQSQRTMSLGGQSAFRDFDQQLYQTKSNMSIGGKSVGGFSTSGFSTSGMSTSGMSTQSTFSGLRHQKSSGSLKDKFKKVFSFGRSSKSSLSNAPISGQINLSGGHAQRSERTSTMTSTTSGRSFSEFLRRSAKPDNYDDNRSIGSAKSTSSFAALKRAGKNLLKKNSSTEQARTPKSSSQSAYEVPMGRTSASAPSSAPSNVRARPAAPGRVSTPTPRMSSGSGFQPGVSPPKNTATASLSVSPAEVDRETSQWSAGSSLEGVLGAAAGAGAAVSSGYGVSGNAVVAEPYVPAPVFQDAPGTFATEQPSAPASTASTASSVPPAITTSLANTLPSDSSSPTSVSSVNGGSAGSETDADEFVAAETVFPKHLGVEDIDNIRTSLDRTKSLERRASRRSRKVTPDSASHSAPEAAVPNPTEVHVHHPKSSLGRSDSTATPRSILKSKQSDGSMVSVDTITARRVSGDVSRASVEQANGDVSRDTIVSTRDVTGDILPAQDSLTNIASSAPIDIEIAKNTAVADPEATPTGLESFMESARPADNGPTKESGTDVESMFANFSSISTDLDLSFSTQLEPLGLPVRPESPTPSQQSSVRSTDSASVSRFATKLKDNLFKRKDSNGFNPDMHQPISEDSTDQDHLSDLGGHLHDHVPLEGSFETASIISTEAPSLTESFRSEGSYSAPVPPQIPGGQRGNAPLRHFSPGPTPSNPNSHNRRFSGGVKSPQTAASRRYHQHGRSSSYSEDGPRAGGSPATVGYPSVHAPSPVSHSRKGNVSFSSRIVIYDTWDAEDYDRRTEPATCNRLTPLLAQQIKEELNNFKMNMDVHHESRIYTHFF